jgi:hypothetical protein
MRPGCLATTNGRDVVERVTQMSSGIPCSPSHELDRLVAEAEIRRVLVSYCQGVDRRLWEQVVACYHEDAWDSHVSFEGSPAELVSWMKGTHRHVEFSMHVLSNVSVRFIGERTARTESYVVCYKALSSSAGDTFLKDASPGASIRRTVASRFIDEFEDRGDGWRISRREVVLEFVRREEESLYLDFPPGALVSRRDQSDLLLRA